MPNTNCSMMAILLFMINENGSNDVSCAVVADYLFVRSFVLFVRSFVCSLFESNVSMKMNENDDEVLLSLDVVLLLLIICLICLFVCSLFVVDFFYTRLVRSLRYVTLHYWKAIKRPKRPEKHRSTESSERASKQSIDRTCATNKQTNTHTHTHTHKFGTNKAHQARVVVRSPSFLIYTNRSVDNSST